MITLEFTSEQIELITRALRTLSVELVDEHPDQAEDLYDIRTMIEDDVYNAEQHAIHIAMLNKRAQVPASNPRLFTTE
jgi:hypothetical protein